MPIQLTSIGTHTQPSGATCVTTVGVAGVPAGCVIIACVNEQGTQTIGATGVSDTANGAYVSVGAISNPSGTQPNVSNIYYHWDNTLALVQNNTITYTANSSGNSSSMSVFYVTGLRTATSPYDANVRNTAQGTSVSPSVISGTPQAAGELIVAMLGWWCTATTFTQDSSNAAWQDFPVSTINSSNWTAVAGGAFVNPGTGTLTYAPTIANLAWDTMIVGFYGGGATYDGVTEVDGAGVTTAQPRSIVAATTVIP